MSTVSRRDFVKVLAVFGSAMALPERLQGQPLPPAQEVIILPPDAITTSLKQFLWIGRIPVTEGFQFRLSYSGRFGGLLMPNDLPVVAIPPRSRLTIEITLLPSAFSRLLGDGLEGRTVEIAFMFPSDPLATIVSAYCASLNARFSSVDTDVISTEFEAVAEPRLIPVSLMPKYLAGLLKE